MIACIGWGSLIWDPRDLEIEAEWQDNGPLLPVEYYRQSQDGRLTLVLDASGSMCRSYWVKMKHVNLDEAAEDLRAREGTVEKYVARWESGESSPELIPSLAGWSDSVGVTGAVWTALPPKFAGVDDRRPTTEEAVGCIRSLDDNEYSKAEEYVRKTPSQIRTAFRDKFEREFDWLPRS